MCPERGPERGPSVALSVGPSEQGHLWPGQGSAHFDPLRHQWLAALLGSSALQKAAQPSSLVSPASPEEQAGWDGALPFCVARCTCA